jgi:hypothetical protein
MRPFVTYPNAIQAQSAIDIAAPPEQVAALYRAVEQWDVTFPATIEHARVIETGDNWQQVEVAHRIEGRVPNTLIFLSDTEIGLEESKKRFDASFLNRFERAAGAGTHYVISAQIRLKGLFGVLKPFLSGYVRGRALLQMRTYVLEPLKAAAESSARESS